MLIVAIDFAFDTDISRREARAACGRPIAVYPAAIDFDLQNRRKQARERPIKTVVDGTASIDRMIERRKVRNNGLVGDTPNDPPACPAWGGGQIGPRAPLDPNRLGASR